MKSRQVFIAFVLSVGLLNLRDTRVSGQQTPKLDQMTHAPIHDIGLRLNQADIDEHIIALSRAEGVPIFADATHFPKDPERLTEDTRSSFGNYLLWMAYQRQLSWNRISEGDDGRGIFGMWPKFKIEPLAQAILDAPVAWIDKNVSESEWKPVKTYLGQVVNEDDTPVDKYTEVQQQQFLNSYLDDFYGLPMRRSQEVGPLLMPYLQEKFGWNGKLNGFKRAIRVADMPPALRDNLLARLQARTFHPYMFATCKLWFDAQNFARMARFKLERSTKTIGPGARRFLVVDNYGPDGLSDMLGVLWNEEPPQVAQVRPTSVKGSRGRNPYLSTLSIPSSNVHETRSNFTLVDLPLEATTPLPQTKLEEPKTAQGKVSFEVKRQPIADLLRDISQQSGTALKLANGAFTGVPFTGRAHDLSLAEAMQGIARLYNGRWDKVEATAYVLQPNAQSATDFGMLQVGDVYWYRFYGGLVGTGPERLHVTPLVHWEDIIPQYLDDPKQIYGQLDKDGNRIGLPVSMLPEEVQQQLLSALQHNLSLEIIMAFDAATLDNLKQAVLTIDMTPPKYISPTVSVGSKLGVFQVSAPGYKPFSFDYQVVSQWAKPGNNAPQADTPGRE